MHPPLPLLHYTHHSNSQTSQTNLQLRTLSITLSSTPHPHIPALRIRNLHSASPSRPRFQPMLSTHPPPNYKSTSKVILEPHFPNESDRPITSPSNPYSNRTSKLPHKESQLSSSSPHCSQQIPHSLSSSLSFNLNPNPQIPTPPTEHMTATARNGSPTQGPCNCRPRV